MDVLWPLLDIFCRFTFISGISTKTGVKLLLTFNIVNIVVSNMRGVRICQQKI